MKSIKTHLSWNSRVSKILVSKSALNKLVMNKLVNDGNKEVANAFARETHIKGYINEKRVAIRHLISEGDIQEAIDLILEHEPELLDTNFDFHFRLRKQKLIEAIRKNDIEEAVMLSQTELAPWGEHNPQRMEDIQAIMLLIAFPIDEKVHPAAHQLLNEKLRIELADEANQLLLRLEGNQIDAKLVFLLKSMKYLQQEVDNKQPLSCKIELN